MPLQKQSIQVPFLKGLNNISDDWSLQPGELLEANNCVFLKSGSIQKRNGFTPLSNSIIGGSSITSALTSTTFNNNLLLMDGYSLYSYAGGSNKWSLEGALIPIQTTSTQVLRDNYSQNDPDVAFTTNTELYVYEDMTSGVYYTLIDHVTRNFLAQKAVINSSATHPKAIAYNQKFYIFYNLSNIFYCAVLDPSIPLTLTTHNLGTFDVSATYPAYDILTTDNYLYVAFKSSTGLCIKRLTTDCTVLNTVVIPNSGRFFDYIQSINMVSDSSNLYVVYSSRDIGNGLYLLFLSSISKASFTELAYYTIESAAYSGFYYGINQITSYVKTNVVNIYYQYKVEVPYTSISAEPQIRFNTYNTATNAVGTPVIFKLKAGLAGKVFYYNTRIFIPTTFTSTLQKTYFLLDEDKNIISIQNQSVGGGLRYRNTLSETPQIADGVFLIAEIKQGNILSNGGSIFTNTGISTSTFKFADNDISALTHPWTPPQSATLGNTLLIAGGCLQAFDGANLTEHGFLLYPEVSVANAVVSAAISTMKAGNYNYTFLYKYIDNSGQAHLSAPSVPIQVTIPADDGYQVSIQIPTLTFTNKTAIQIIGYRTDEILNNNPIYYRFTSLYSPSYNSLTSNFITIVDTNTNFSTSNDILYTTGNIVDNIAAPSCTMITTFKNRIFIGGLEDPNTLWYSKSIVPGEPVSFNDSFYIKVDDEGGPITGLGVMDDALIIFKNNRIYHLTGEGPDNTGSNNDFLDPQSIATPVGCNNPNSIGLTYLGLIFSSTKGIYLLNRSFGLEYIGANVSKYAAQTIVSVVDVPNYNQIRVLCSDGYALIYDYYFTQWSTFSNYESTSAGVWNNIFYLIKSNGILYQETPNLYLDSATPISMRLMTNWFSFADIQGYQRVWDLLILGRYAAAHSLTLQVCYDFDDTIVDTRVIAITSALEQIRLFFSQQKCESLKLIISESDAGNAALSFNSLNFQAGKKQGNKKISSIKQV